MITISKALVTVGLPFYNNVKTLSDAICSVICQTYKDWELILIDDGSTDGSGQIAKHFSDKYENIHLISDPVNRGLIFRLNQIIDLTQSEFIARMDSDDIMMPKRLEKQMEHLTLNQHIDVIDSGMFTIDDHNVPIGKRGLNKLDLVNRKSALKCALLNHPTVLARSCWFKLNRYSENFVRAEDYELWCRTFMQAKFARIQEPLLLYREGKINISNYNLSMHSVRKIFLAYGPQILSIPALRFEIIRTYLKSAIYSFMGIWGAQGYLSSRRNQALSNEERDLIAQTILLVRRKQNSKEN